MRIVLMWNLVDGHHAIGPGLFESFDARVNIGGATKRKSGLEHANGVASPVLIFEGPQRMLNHGQSRRIVSSQLRRSPKRYVGTERAGDLSNLLVLGAYDYTIESRRSFGGVDCVCD